MKRRLPPAGSFLVPAFVFGAIAPMTACAPATEGAGPAIEAPRSGPLEYVRDVYPFEVLDAGGNAYEHPFLGGFTVPRPQFVDIDADGTLDLFVHERTNELMYLENVGSPDAPRYEWRTDRWQELDTGEWTRFMDLDGDGRIDLLAEELYSYIRVYRNEGTPEEPRMVLVQDSLRDDRGQPIFADRQNVPAFHDIDDNGRTDLFLGRIEGTVARYQSVGTPQGEPLPRFRLVAERFEGIEIIGTLVQPTMRHGANSMYFADADGDGIQDLYWGDFFEAGLLILENRGSRTNPSFTNVPRPVHAGGEPIVTSGFNAPVLADVSRRGVPDLFIGVLGGAYNPGLTAADNFHHYRNDGSGNFELVTTRYLNGIDIGEESVPAVGDVTGNGRADLLVGNKSDPGVGTTARLYWFENQGDAGDPRFQLRDTLSLAPAHNYAPSIAPLWDDPLPGLAMGTFSGEIHFYRNTGGGDGPRFELQDDLTLELERGTHSVPVLVDLEGRGLLDLVVGRSNGELAYYRNVGSASEPRFELVSDQWLDIRVGRRSHPAFTDLTGDGRQDLVIGQEGGGAVVFRNTGSPTEPDFDEDPSIQIPLHPYGSPVFWDLSGDGREEVIAGGASGGLIYFRPR